MKDKTLHNSDVSGAKQNVPDLEVFGDGDMWKLLCKASSQAEGWMKSTKAMEIEHLGVIIQVTTQQRNPDGSYAISESVTSVISDLKIVEDYDGDSHLIGRHLEKRYS